MKIKSKRLIFAICLLLVSAVMVGTASFAWFSMNTEVAVDGIEVEAYSDSLFLEISTKEDQDYNTSVSLAGDKQYLRLAKHGFVNAAYTVEASAASGTYNGTGNYYKKVEFVDSYLKYVIADDLVAPSSDVKGLYKNPSFNLITDDSAVMVSGTVYYEKLGTQFKQITTTAGNPAVGYYTLGLVYTAAGDSTTTAEDGKTYYSLANGVYTVVENIEVGVTLVGDYFTAAAITPEVEGANYVDGAKYYKLAENSRDFYLVNPVVPGSSLTGYYTLVATQITTLTDFTGHAYAMTANNEYSYLGEFTNADLTKGYLYFGRTYSDSITDGEKNNSLNVIKDDNNNYLDNYRYTSSIYLRNANNTNDSRNLQAVFSVDGNNALTSALRVVVVVYDITGTEDVFVNYVEYSNRTGNTTYGNGKTNIINLLAGNTAQTLRADIYVYYDGSDDAAKNATNGVLNLSGDQIEVKFTIDGPDYN